MKIPWFEIINYTLILVVFVLFARYILDMLTGSRDKPQEWKEAVRAGRIDKMLRKMERNYPDKVRFFNWWFQVERLRRENIPGVFAELGVYKGDSARILNRMDPLREMHLFDTFGGLPAEDLKVETGKAAGYTPRNFSDTSIQKVKERIGSGGNIHFHPGHFPETTEGLEQMVFSLVNIDADLYLPTKAALDFFYPRLSPGGVILVHDHNPKWEGVIRAVGEFSDSIPEIPIILPDADGTAVIIRNRNIA